VMGELLVRRSTDVFDLGRPFPTEGMYRCFGPAAGKGRRSIAVERVKFSTPYGCVAHNPKRGPEIQRRRPRRISAIE
jgi:hypothetical protein